MIVETLVVGQLDVNCYVLGCERTRLAVVIDAGDDAPSILTGLERHGLQLAQIIATHGHFDHIMAVRPLQEATGASFALHPADLPLLAALGPWAKTFLGVDPGPPPQVQAELAPGQQVTFGDETLEIRSTPGHTPGSVTLVDHRGRRAFTGDALFAGAIGRTQAAAEFEQLVGSIMSQIMVLPADYAVLSGHGPASSVGQEQRSNPFLLREARRRGS